MIQDDAAMAVGVLVNDSDPDDTLFIASATQPANGDVVLIGGSPGAHTDLTYQPDPGYCNSSSGPSATPDTFTYTLTLGPSAKVKMTVYCLSVAVNDIYTAAIDTTLNVNAASGVTFNDTLNGGAIVSYGATGVEQAILGTATATAQGGSVTLNADGSFTYVPPTGYLGDDTFKYVLQNAGGNSTATVTITVGKKTQTISFDSTAPAGATVGGPTYTVIATATSGLPVALTIDPLASSVCSISGSTVSFIGAGTCIINANQPGDASYSAAPQAQQSFPVGQSSQTISFTSSPPAMPTVGGATYTVTATATSGLPVTFTIDASASTVCSISGSTVSFIGSGTCVINANQAGDANYSPAPQVQQSFAVKANQTISFTSPPPATPTVGGATYTVTATATSGLTVAFTIDASASTVCSIAGSTVSFIGNGTCVINADQAGDANYYPAPQVQQSFEVKTGQTISFTSSPPATPTVGGPTYTVTATATSSLPVTFTIDASASTVCSISGSTVSFIGNGMCVINANQAGDATYHAAPQVQQSFGVKSSQAISFTSSPPAMAAVGGATYTVTATATSGLPVTFTIDASASTVCSISGSTVSFIGNGTCVINADQAGDANYYAAPQVQQSFGVKTAQTISFTSPPPAMATVGGATYTVTATATSGLPVTFTIDPSASAVCSISGSTVSFIGNGTCVINADQAGDADYYAAPQVQQSFGVKTAQTISFTSSPPAMATVGGATYTVTATATSGLPVTFTIDPSASAVCSISGSTVSFIGNGTCVINANQAGDANYYAAPQVQQSFGVKTAQTISFTSSPPAMPTVGGATYTVTATATSGLPVAFTIDASASAVCTISGSTVSFIGNGTCVINANQAGDANYYPAPQVQQSFSVKSPQTITFTSTPPSPAARIGGPTYTVTATATSGLPVTFTIDASASAVCTISGSTVSFIGGGTCVINANQAGDANYYPAPQVQQSFYVNFPPVIPTTATYTTPGNTQLHVGVTLPGVAAWTDATGLRAKSGASDPDSFPPPPTLNVVPASGTTANGGSYSIDPDGLGKFTYVPPAGFTGTDSFNFQVTDTLDTTTGTVNITVGQRVWYIHDVVDANNAAGGDGRSTNAFDSIAAFNAATTNDNDIIFVFRGNTGTTPHSGGLTLRNGQKLHGQGIGLTVPGFGTPLVAAGSRPRISNTGGDAVSVPATAGNRQNVEIRGLDLSGSVNAIDVTASGANQVSVTISDNDIPSSGAEGIDLNAGSTGAFTATVSNNAIAATGNGFDARTSAATTMTIDFSNNAAVSNATAILIDGSGGGSATTITGFANNAVSGSTGGTGIAINAARFDQTPGGTFQTVSGGSTVVGASGAGNGVGGAGVVMTNVSGDLTFTDLDIFTDAGAGLSATSTAAYNGSAGFQLSVGTASSVTAVGGPAVSVDTVSGSLPFGNVSSTSQSTGISLVNFADGSGNAVFSATGGSLTNSAGATGPVFNVSGGNAKITYPGPITNNGTGRAVSINNWSGDDASPGDDLLLSGAIDENGAGILVNGSGGSRSITFSGGMDIDTNTGEGFAATSNTNTGGLHITGTNTIDSVSAAALRVTNTTIGNSNLNFQRISSGNNTAAPDPANGIVLSNTGSSGGLIVTGNGGSCAEGSSTCTGGWIQNMTGSDDSGPTPGGTGIVLNNTANVSLTRVRINDTSNYGIRGTSVSGFTFTNGVVDGANGTNVSTPFNEGSMLFFGVTGTSSGMTGTSSITNSTIMGGRQRNIAIDNSVGSLNLTVSGNIIKRTSDAAGDDGFSLEADTTANVTLAITNNTFARHGGDHINISLVNNAVVDATITNNVLHGNYTGTPEGNHPIGLGQGIFILGATFNGTFTYEISGNGTDAVPFRGNRQGGAIHVNKGSGTGIFSGSVENNVIGDAAITGSGSSEAFGIIVGARGAGGAHTTLINNNKVRQYFDRGIVLEAGEGSAALNATVTNNTVSNFADATNSLHGIHSDNGILAGDTNAVCLQISGNSVATAGNEPQGGADIRLRRGSSTTVTLPGVAGATNANATTLLQANNPTATTITVTGNGFSSGAACPVP